MTDPEDLDQDEFEEPGSRSLFSALWFRATLVVVVLGIVAAAAIPSLLDFVNPTPPATLATAPASESTGDAAPAVAPPAASAPGESPSAAAPAPSVAASESQATPSAVPAAPEASPAAPATTSAPVAALAPEGAKAPAADANRGGNEPAAAAPAPASDRSAASAADRSDRKTAPAATAARAATVERRSAPARQRGPLVASIREAEPRRPEARERPAARRIVATPGGDYWVQVGAFRDEAAAKRLAARLRELHYRVEESTTSAERTASGPAVRARADRYQVIVSGASPAEIEPKLAGKNLTAEADGADTRITPPLALAAAVAVSRELRADGHKVQVRRVEAPGGAAAGDAAPAGTSETLYRVRVGGYADRASAVSVMRELQAKGYTPFVARAGQ